MYGIVVPGQPVRFAMTVRVADLAELEWLVKEGEVVTGRQGRQFDVHLSDGVTSYDVRLVSAGFEIRPVHEAQGAAVLVSRTELPKTSFGEAMLAGRLFTAAL